MDTVRHSIIILLLAVFTIVSCQFDIPIKKMTDAKKEISLALSVKADMYAPEELAGAQDSLLACHEKLKKENTDAATKSAEEAFDLARKAFDKSIPLLAKETGDIAEKSFAEATEAYAERLAQNEYAEAKSELEKSRNFFQNNQFYDAYLAALNADRLAKAARDKASEKKDELRDMITQVNLTIGEAKKYNAEKYAKEKLDLAVENNQIAQQSYDESQIKKGYSAVEVARINADDALALALEQTAKEGIANAEVIFDKSEKSGGSKSAKDEFAAAQESLANARNFLSDMKYRESIAASDEAIRLATIVIASKDAGEQLPAGKDQGAADTVASSADSASADNDEYLMYTVVYRERLKDCLWRIADRYYKDPLLWREIYKVNMDRITNPNLILPGWVLKVPKKYMKSLPQS